ncbi:MAG: ankyrin repeat domain-containing protein [Desulfovibrionaceae bacterium]|nr:ankyrin repeat domain-containing protein [Desulfovibrionaceae bacterium]
MEILLFLVVLFAVLFAAQVILYSIPPGPTKRQEKRLFSLIFQMIDKRKDQGEIDIPCYLAMEILDRNDRFTKSEDSGGHPAYLLTYDNLTFRITLLMAGCSTLVRIGSGTAPLPDKDSEGKIDAAFSAIKAGDIQQVQQLFASGLSVNARHSSEGSCPLHMAAICGRLDIMKWLLDHGADINARDFTGYTPLLSCLWMAAQQALHSNPDAGLPPERQSIIAKMPPLQDIRAAILFLIQNGADGNVAGDRGLLAIHWAVLMQDEEIIWALLRSDGVSPSAVPRAFETPPMARARDIDGNTPLILAAGIGNTAAIELLRHNGAIIDEANNVSQTALIAAALNKKAGAAELLLRLGADISCKTQEGLTALHLAAHNDDADTLAILIQHHAELDAKDNEGWSALMLAARDGRENALRMLCESGADTESALPSGQTPLQAAAANNHPGCVSILLRCGANIDHQDSTGATALSWAARNGHFAIVKALCEAGAQTDLAANGLTPEHLAQVKGHMDIAEYLASRA